MDTALSPPVGQLLGGRYHVDSRIARGGMATVYLGTDTRLDRVVALKIAHPELSDDAEFVRRFIGEARSAARLSSPNVVAIFDQGSDKRLHYIAMEYVPGRTLRQLLNERGRLGVREALDIMSGVLTGLAAAHEAGFAHRDVKPENVLLTPSGGVKVADFGLARAVAGAVQTKGGMIIGTAAYLAPEQVSGGTSDARTDVYAAGIMLFELLTGVQPHTAESPLAVAYKHVNEIVPAPSSILPGLSGAVDALVAMATSRDPELRPAHAGQFLRAIAQVRDGQMIPATTPYHAPDSYAGAAAPLRGPGEYRESGAHRMPPAFQGSGPHQRPGGSRPYQGMPPAHPSGPLPFGDSRDGTLQMPAPGERDGYGGYPGYPGPGYPGPGYPGPGYSGPGRHDAAPGAVGASALPSLSPQASQELAAPHGGADHLANHTLVVADPGMLDGYDSPGGDSGRSLRGGYHGRRSASQARGPWLRLSGRLMWLSAALVLVLVIALGAWWFNSGQYQQVPALRAMTLRTAENVLTNEGLKATLGQAAHSPLPKGEVVRTVPSHGQRVSGGATVRLIVSLGPIMRTIPNVSGEQEAAAKTALRQAHLIVGQDKPETSSSVPTGYVIGTLPSAYSRIAQNTPVRLIVSEGPGLPNFVGMQVSDAQSAASSGGYQINAVPDKKGKEPANTITSQSPPAGTPITSGEVVTVHFSPGPPAVAVPNVQGLPLWQAIKELRAAGFGISVSHQGPGDRVGSYTPTSPQPKGTVITLNVGIFSGM